MISGILLFFTYDNSRPKAGIFNPVLLAGCQTNGYTRIGKAAKISKAKKLTKVCTIGVPLFLQDLYIYQKNRKDFQK